MVRRIQGIFYIIKKQETLLNSLAAKDAEKKIIEKLNKMKNKLIKEKQFLENAKRKHL